jgi:hypothetical protein
MHYAPWDHQNAVNPFTRRSSLLGASLHSNFLRLTSLGSFSIWLAGIRVASAAFLPELQVVDRREFGVLDAGLPALEVLQIDLGLGAW